MKVIVEMDLFADIDEVNITDEEKFYFIEEMISLGAESTCASVNIKSIEIKK